jgi:hypothetical protein
VQGRHLAQRLGATFLPSILLIAGCHADPPSGTVADASAAPAIEASAPPPVSVTVPSVGISSKLVRLGLHDDRTMEVPVDYDVAGWYVHGPRPGDLGPAIIAGHVDSKSFDRGRGHYRDNIVVYASLTGHR